jgi:hypothetical protein
LNEGGIGFFGPSGAGKTTISKCAPFPVLSDELIVVGDSPPVLQASGFWGTAQPTEGTVGESPLLAPLLALVQLSKGSSFGLEPLARCQAWPRLLNELVVPTSPLLWRSSINVLWKLLESVPVLTLTWSPKASPWEELKTSLQGWRAGHTPESDRFFIGQDESGNLHDLSPRHLHGGFP